MTTSTRTVKPRLSAAERRAAQVAGLATQQAQLKHEAAERRLARQERAEPTPSDAPAERTGPDQVSTRVD